MPVECPESKSIVKSKMNWTGLVMVLLGAVTDPSFRTLFGDLIPEQWLSRILFISGWAVIGLRTFGTTQPVSRNWKLPWDA